jgi:hypothetical protein
VADVAPEELVDFVADETFGPLATELGPV